LTSRDEGLAGEEMAIKTLKRNGYRIVERNWRSRSGEIDVIAEDHGCLVFVEVKKRNSGRFGEAVDAVNEKKKKHLINAALFYMKEHHCFDRRARFDVVGIDSDRVKVIKNAFLVEGYHG
jgi:putative endonuclease